LFNLHTKISFWKHPEATGWPLRCFRVHNICQMKTFNASTRVAKLIPQNKYYSQDVDCGLGLTLCLSLRSIKGHRTWWRRLIIRRFSSSVSKACRRFEEQIKTQKLASITADQIVIRWRYSYQQRLKIITCSSADGSATFSKGLLNHWAKSSEELKMLGNKKFSSAHSSSKLFWNDKHNNKKPSQDHPAH